MQTKYREGKRFKAHVKPMLYCMAITAATIPNEVSDFPIADLIPDRKGANVLKKINCNNIKMPGL